MIAYYRAPFAHPLLLVGDEKSREQLPVSDPRLTDDQVMAGSSVMGVRVQPASDGPAGLYVWPAAERSGAAVAAFVGQLHVSSGRLWIGDFLMRHGLTLQVPAGAVQVGVVLTDPPYAQRVDFVVSSDLGEIPLMGS